ncbi:hypothetical protein BDV26DRAFT_288467 [Aspergillus bertholletiae]|uniref:N-acetyltransferase domain-containing protein n=1 Tax=Aspergillus bertholletiae TaxID=1226010 RepID=A0A5N7BKW8_9EURO|nr:hypothetical protein BDV26DRAFT_288467 [Aspergillus bertholletiae]
MSTNYTYSYFRVPKTELISESGQKYRNLRLNALQVSPSSFSSTIEIESAFTDEVWASRVAQSGTEVFICAIDASAATGPGSDSGNWVGQVTLHGPKSVHELGPPDASLCSNMDNDGEWWQMLSLFILPDHRGKGLAKRLCEEALNYLRNYWCPATSLNVRLMVKPENHITVELYKRLGFEVSGRCTLAEALIANGDAEYLPQDITDEKYSARTGLVLILHLSRSRNL